MLSIGPRLACDLQSHWRSFDEKLPCIPCGGASMSKLPFSFPDLEHSPVVPLAALDLQTLEGLLILGTVVMVIALFLIALTRNKTPAKMR